MVMIALFFFVDPCCKTLNSMKWTNERGINRVVVTLMFSCTSLLNSLVLRCQSSSRVVCPNVSFVPINFSIEDIISTSGCSWPQYRERWRAWWRTVKGVARCVFKRLLQIAGSNVCFVQGTVSATAYEKYNINNSIAIYMYNTMDLKNAEVPT